MFEFRRTRRVAQKGLNYGKVVVNAEQIQQTGSWIGRMAREALTRPDSVREETFANAMARLGLSEADLMQSHRFHTGRFYLFGAFGALGLGVLVHSLATGQPWTAVMSVGFLALMVAQMVRASFRAFQIEQRELVGFGAWWSQPMRWVPGTFVPAPTSRSERRTKPKSRS